MQKCAKIKKNLQKSKKNSKLYTSASYEWFFMSPGYVLVMILKYFFLVKLPTSDRNFCFILHMCQKPSKAKISQLQAEISDQVKIFEMKVCSKSFPQRLSWPIRRDFGWLLMVTKIGKFWKKKFLKKTFFFWNFLKFSYFSKEVGQLHENFKKC